MHLTSIWSSGVAWQSGECWAYGMPVAELFRVWMVVHVPENIDWPSPLARVLVKESRNGLGDCLWPGICKLRKQ